MGDVISNIMIVLSLIAAGIFGFIVLKQKGVIKVGKDNIQNPDYQNLSNVSAPAEGELVDKSKLQDIFEIREIDESNIIYLDKNNSMRVIFSVSTPDIYLLNEDEQTSFENSLLNLALSFDFPIQFFTTTRKIQTKKSTERIKKLLGSTDQYISQALKEYAQQLSDQLEMIEQNRNINEIKNYCIIGVDNFLDEKRAKNTLSSRIETVVKGFTAAKIKINIVEKDAALQLFTDTLNRGENISLEELSKSDVFGMYSVGIKRKGDRA